VNRNEMSNGMFLQSFIKRAGDFFYAGSTSRSTDTFGFLGNIKSDFKISSGYQIGNYGHHILYAAVHLEELSKDPIISSYVDSLYESVVMDEKTKTLILASAKLSAGNTNITDGVDISNESYEVGKFLYQTSENTTKEVNMRTLFGSENNEETIIRNMLLVLQASSLIVCYNLLTVSETPSGKQRQVESIRYSMDGPLTALSRASFLPGNPRTELDPLRKNMHPGFDHTLKESALEMMHTIQEVQSENERPLLFKSLIKFLNICNKMDAYLIRLLTEG
jgi:hypothetical protein